MIRAMEKNNTGKGPRGEMVGISNRVVREGFTE
jgi:hypothetical protein